MTPQRDVYGRALLGHVFCLIALLLTTVHCAPAQGPPAPLQDGGGSFAFPALNTSNMLDFVHSSDNGSNEGSDGGSDDSNSGVGTLQDAMGGSRSSGGYSGGSSLESSGGASSNLTISGNDVLAQDEHGRMQFNFTDGTTLPVPAEQQTADEPAFLPNEPLNFTDSSSSSAPDGMLTFLQNVELGMDALRHKFPGQYNAAQLFQVVAHRRPETKTKPSLAQRNPALSDWDDPFPEMSLAESLDTFTLYFSMPSRGRSFPWQFSNNGVWGDWSTSAAPKRARYPAPLDPGERGSGTNSTAQRGSYTAYGNKRMLDVAIKPSFAPEDIRMPTAVAERIIRYELATHPDNKQNSARKTAGITNTTTTGIQEWPAPPQPAAAGDPYVVGPHPMTASLDPTYADPSAGAFWTETVDINRVDGLQFGHPDQIYYNYVVSRLPTGPMLDFYIGTSVGDVHWGEGL